MRKVIAAVLIAAALVGGTAAPILTEVAHANPHCAGNSDNFKHPKFGVIQNHPACR
jgi:hypothetical protein